MFCENEKVLKKSQYSTVVQRLVPARLLESWSVLLPLNFVPFVYVDRLQLKYFVLFWLWTTELHFLEVHHGAVRTSHNKTNTAFAIKRNSTLPKK